MSLSGLDRAILFMRIALFVLLLSGVAAAAQCDTLQERASDFAVPVSTRLAMSGASLVALQNLVLTLKTDTKYSWNQRMLSSYRVVVTPLKGEYRILFVPDSFFEHKIGECDGRLGCPTVEGYVDANSLRVKSWRYEI